MTKAQLLARIDQVEAAASQFEFERDEARRERDALMYAQRPSRQAFTPQRADDGSRTSRYTDRLGRVFEKRTVSNGRHSVATIRQVS